MMHQREPRQSCVIQAKISVEGVGQLLRVTAECTGNGVGQEGPRRRRRVELPEVIVCQVAHALIRRQAGKSSAKLDPRAGVVLVCCEASQHVENSVGASGRTKAVAGPRTSTDARHELKRVARCRELVDVVVNLAWVS